CCRLPGGCHYRQCQGQVLLPWHATVTASKPIDGSFQRHGLTRRQVRRCGHRYHHEHRVFVEVDREPFLHLCHRRGPCWLVGRESGRQLEIDRGRLADLSGVWCVDVPTLRHLELDADEKLLTGCDGRGIGNQAGCHQRWLVWCSSETIARACTEQQDQRA